MRFGLVLAHFHRKTHVERAGLRDFRYYPCPRGICPTWLEWQKIGRPGLFLRSEMGRRVAKADCSISPKPSHFGLIKDSIAVKRGVHQWGSSNWST